ncbi:uncharacterized protein BCR38DRAFT_115101 [Pseudomassariella vexata]|uniref:Uncharacterized protein n=1 Tax=Pseudomassariella vexata TaxID=1141098 RepID=A0A1Y2DD56_9PEZI|nr:uncharacterized protein BCR38DRAFT_115101 [Pseudomassariella vexata]ORY56625.1 hypothetical protein BCR38DRAFT_115101 [Pseudomassariella vexata]
MLASALSSEWHPNDKLNGSNNPSPSQNGDPPADSVQNDEASSPNGNPSNQTGGSSFLSPVQHNNHGANSSDSYMTMEPTEHSAIESKGPPPAYTMPGPSERPPTKNYRAKALWAKVKSKLNHLASRNAANNNNPNKTFKQQQRDQARIQGTPDHVMSALACAAPATTLRGSVRDKLKKPFRRSGGGAASKGPHDREDGPALASGALAGFEDGPALENYGGSGLEAPCVKSTGTAVAGVPAIEVTSVSDMEKLSKERT